MNTETPWEMFKTGECPGMRKCSCKLDHNMKLCLKSMNRKNPECRQIKRHTTLCKDKKTKVKDKSDETVKKKDAL